MEQIKIKLAPDQISKVIGAYDTGRKRTTVRVEFKDLLGDERTPVANVSKGVLNDITSAFNDQRHATIRLQRRAIIQLAEQYKAKQEKKAKMEGGGALTTTDENQLKKYAEKLGIEPFSVISIDEPIDDICIYNSTPRADGGMHWCCLFIDSKQNYVFDPFGLPPDTRIIKQIRAKNKNRIMSSTLQEQGIDESSCGQRCLVLLNKLFNASEADRPEVFYKHCTTKKDINKLWKKLGL